MPNRPYTNRNLYPQVNMWDGISSMLDLLENALVGSAPKLYFDATINETDDNYIVIVQLSGFDRDDVFVELNGNYLTVTACKITQSGRQNSYFSGYRFSARTYTKSFYVQDVYTDSIDSSYASGVLVLRLTKKKQFKSNNRRQYIR